MLIPEIHAPETSADQDAVLHADDEKDFGKAGATPTRGNLPRFRKSTRMSTRMNRRRIRS